MLKRISKINGIGLFYAPDGVSTPDFEQLTLLYGENARGKSTLAAILSSAVQSDPAPISARETIDQDTSPEVCLEFRGGNSACFRDGQWKGDATSLRVFDSEFIDRNVHSGSVINVSHRRNLLDFAIGEKAVEARNRQSLLAKEKSSIETNLKEVTAELNKYAGTTPLEDFLALPEVPSIDARIKETSDEYDSVKARRVIANQALPETLTQPKLDIDHLLGTLQKSLGNLHEAAEESVSNHIHHLGTATARSWISEGQTLVKGDACPFCGQNITHVDLIKHYQSVFNEEYESLHSQVISQEDLPSRAFAGCDPDTLESRIESSKKAIEAWQQHGVATPSPGITNHALMRACFEEVCDFIDTMIRSKREDLNWIPMRSQQESLRESYSRYCESILSENSIIKSANEAIREYVETLGRLDEESVENELTRLKLSKVRHLEEVVDLANKRADLNEKLAENIGKSKKARDDERSEMNDLLGRYTESINEFLAKLHAPFKIKDPAANFAGGPPGANYVIEIRKHEASLTGEKRSFRTALSESDKRTMAFAFFLASTFKEPALPNLTVVVDDPMSSLDRNRRENTIFALSRLMSHCQQLIVLAHDPKFLLQLKGEIAKTKKADSGGGMHKIQTVEIKLGAAAVDPNLEYYTAFTSCDLEEECESKYAKNYRILCDFLDDPSKSHEEAARAIRPLLEGYLHRRFPTRLPKNSMFGVSIKKIVEADDSSPLASAKREVPDLKRIAYFGNDSHHDTDSDYSPPLPSHTATVGFAQECLTIIHGFSGSSRTRV